MATKKVERMKRTILFSHKKEKQEEIIKELKEMRKKMEEKCIEEVAKVKLDKDKLIEKVEMLQAEISNIDTYKIKVKRLEEELLASKTQLTKSGNEIFLLKKYRREVEEYKKKMYEKKGRKPNKDYKK